MGSDQREVDAAGDQGFECRIGGWLVKAVEPAVLQVRDTRRELKAEQGEERKDVFGIAAAVSVVTAHRDFALVVQEPVEDMQSLARRRRDHLGVERSEAGGEGCVNVAPGVIAVMDIGPAGGAAQAAGPEELAVR